MNTKPNFLLIEHGGNRKQFTLDVLLARDLNLFVACSTVPDWLTEYISSDNIIQTDTYNSIRLLSDVVSFSEIAGITFDGIGTFFEHTVIQTADLANALGVVGIPPAAARKSSCNKLLMRKTCREAGIATPRFRVIKTLDTTSLTDAIEQVGIPCVVKPIFGSESYGTVKIEEGFDIQSVIAEIQLNTDPSKKETFKNFTQTFLIEEYLPGNVVSVDGLVQNNQAMIVGMVEFVMGPEPRFTQEANYIPARVDVETRNRCEEMARSIVSALGFNNCGFHCEMRLIPDRGPVLLEIAARLPGGPLQPGHLKSSGVNMTSALIDIWLGKEVSLDPKVQSHILQKAVFPRKKGTIDKFEIPQDLHSYIGVWELVPIVAAGETVIMYPDIPKPFYYYAIHAPSAEELQVLSDYVESQVIVEIVE